ncbi:MAG: hypothetical protein Edafosvirus3_38 [Edafosvirus sp.]|uniref:Uncharacterized protein n=1 Tax=Edafosvirus sp. TaxID=2487765 RepID=A0A3G4ZST6_9VIRU|nr:MAG: hypothetical protein Edafosvirus3_38 [Edafosvirus sp.]
MTMNSTCTQCGNHVRHNHIEKPAPVVEENKEVEIQQEVEPCIFIKYEYTSDPMKKTKFVKRLIVMACHYDIYDDDVAVKYGAAIFRQTPGQYKKLNIKEIRQNLIETATARYYKNPVVVDYLGHTYKEMFTNSKRVQGNTDKYRSGDIQYMVRKLVHKLGVKGKSM